MNVERFEIEGLKLITPKVYSDNRGFFTERYNVKAFEEIGVPGPFVQDNYSRSAFKVLRGLHYQRSPEQGKLVTCARGKIIDVALDLRKGSPTFGKHQTVVLDDSNPQWFWIPAGFAHGFAVLSEQGADVMYKIDSPYNPKTEVSIAWNDKSLNINWQIENPILSAKDASAPSWNAVQELMA